MRNFWLAPMAMLAFATGAGWAGQAAAAITVLSFNDATCEGGSCSDQRIIDAGYGDGAGVDVRYQSLIDGALAQPFLRYWSAEYGDLNGVVYGGANPFHYRSEIILQAKPGYEISLIGFDFATYRRSSATTPIMIDTLGGTQIFAERLNTTPGGHSHLEVNSSYVTDGIRLAWGPDGFNVGMDNIAFDVRRIDAGAVPEPGAWALMILGFGVAGAALRRGRVLAAAV